MKITIKRFSQASLLLALALLVPLFVLPLAHAGTYVGYGSANCNSCGPTSWTNNYGVGETIQAPFAGTLVTIGVFTGTTAPSNVIILTTASSVTSFGFGSCGGTPCTSITDNTFSFTVADDEPVTLSTNNFNTVNLANPVTVTNGQFVSVVFTGTASSCQNNACMGTVNKDTGNNAVVLGTCYNFATNTPGIGSSFTARSVSGSGDANCSGTGGTIAGGSFNPTGSGSSGGVTVTQCYGNCGNPAITLANTNSTHAVSFNQTITLFYEFQANLNGFVLNVTTSFAKTLLGNQFLAVYEIPSCNQGLTPFTAACPGLLQQSQSQLGTKGKNTMTVSNLPVFNGQWVGIAVTSTLTGTDINDTNTNVNLFQTNEGRNPAIIQAGSLFGSSKMGLWAWIKGNVVSGNGPSSPPSTACGPGLDFILTCAVNSLCTVITTQCQTGASIFLIVVLTIFSLGVTLGIFSYWLPNINLSTKGMGEFGVLIFIGWLTAFGAFGLILPWLLILLFFVISWLFIGRLKGSGPI